MRPKLPSFMASLLLIFFESCYTVLLPPEPSARELEIREFFAQRPIRNDSLFGTWTISDIVADYGLRIKELVFTPGGEFQFFPNSEYALGGKYTAQYTMVGDTLLLYFKDIDLLEKHLFRFDGDFLVLTWLEGDNGETISERRGRFGNRFDFGGSEYWRRERP
jgi:hypothetical protein